MKIRDYIDLIPSDAYVIIAEGQYGDFPAPKTFWMGYANELASEDEILDRPIGKIIPSVVYNHVVRGGNVIPAAAATMIVV